MQQERQFDPTALLVSRGFTPGRVLAVHNPTEFSFNDLLNSFADWVELGAKILVPLPTDIDGETEDVIVDKSTPVFPFKDAEYTSLWYMEGHTDKSDQRVRMLVSLVPCSRIHTMWIQVISPNTATDGIIRVTDVV